MPPLIVSFPIHFMASYKPSSQGLVFTIVVLRSSDSNDRRYTESTAVEAQSSSGRRSVKSNGRISLPIGQSSSDSEGVHVHLERIVHHDCADHERDSEIGIEKGR